MNKFIFSLFLVLPLAIFSQNYQSALGVKVGYPGYLGLNGKFLIGNKFALDNTIGTNFEPTSRFIGGQMYLEYNKLFGINEGYNWYVGFGPNINYYLKDGFKNKDGSYRTEKLFLKTDALFGIEYIAPKTFFNVAFEAGPSLNVLPFVKFGAFANVALRFKIKDRKKAFSSKNYLKKSGK